MGVVLLCLLIRAGEQVRSKSVRWQLYEWQSKFFHDIQHIQASLRNPEAEAPVVLQFVVQTHG